MGPPTQTGLPETYSSGGPEFAHFPLLCTCSLIPLKHGQRTLHHPLTLEPLVRVPGHVSHGA